MAGFVFYRGASLIDGAPIVGVAIVGSKNSKTGSVVQAYVIRDDVSPLEASKSGQDASICGNCKHRGTATDDHKAKQAKERSCYVLLGRGPTIVFKGLQRGIYPDAEDAMIERMTIGSMVRMGAYGDPAAIPMNAWQRVLRYASGHTGYTHNAHVQPDITTLCMVSADSIEQVNKGYRTFRVVPLSQAHVSLALNEILCPSAKVQCSDCRLCTGTTASNAKVKSIAIIAHGAGAKYA